MFGQSLKHIYILRVSLHKRLIIVNSRLYEYVVVRVLALFIVTVNEYPLNILVSYTARVGGVVDAGIGEIGGV